MKDKKVIITADRIQLAEPKNYLNSGIVMDKVAKPITKKFCEVVGETRGHILDVGFGLGYSAQYFYEMGVKSYTCIEINEQVYEKALQWAKDKQNVHIILGDWIDIIPTLTSKYDGIFMDTYGDSFTKYGQFEDTCSDIANENCVLSLYEYERVENPVYLNRKLFSWKQGEYELKLKRNHSVCWKYYVGGTFRKEKFYDTVPSLPSSMIDEILSQDLAFEKANFEAIVDGSVRRSEFEIATVKHNCGIVEYVNFLYPEYENLDFEDIDIAVISRFKKGGHYDMHIETVKHLSLDDKEQLKDVICVQLNEEYEGGETYIHDNWLNSNAVEKSIIPKQKGSAVKYKPYQHVTDSLVTQGEKLQLLLFLSNGTLKRRIKTIL